MNGHVTVYVNFFYQFLQQKAENMLRREGFEVIAEESKADIAITDNIERARNLAAPSVVFVSSCTNMPFLPETVFQLPRQFTGDDIKTIHARGRHDYFPE